MNPLVIGQPELAALSALRDRAARAPLDITRVLDDMQTTEGVKLHMERMCRQSVCLPVDYVVTYALEIGHEVGAVRHVSVCLLGGEAQPAPSVVWTIALELGFVGDFDACVVWFDELPTFPALRPVGRSVHLVQPMAAVFGGASEKPIPAANAKRFGEVPPVLWPEATAALH